MKPRGERAVVVLALVTSVSVAWVAQSSAQERGRGDAEAILAAKELARGEALDPKIRAALRNRMEALSLERLAELAAQGAEANLPLALGSVTSDLVYTPVTPCRVFDSRVSQGGPGPIPANSQRNVFVAGTLNFPAQGGLAGGCGVPVGATSAIINFVTVLPAGPGNIRAWAVTPGGMQLPAPLAAVLNYGAVTGLPAIANGVAVPLCDPAAGSCGGGDLRLQADTSGTDILGDVVGYFQNPTAVPGTVTATAVIGGFVGPLPANVSGNWVFTGPTATIAAAAGQRLFGTAVLPMSAASVAVAWDVCYKLGAGAVTNMAGVNYPATALVATTIPYPASASKILAAAGTYTVGFCTKDNGALISANSVNGYFTVVNP